MIAPAVYLLCALASILCMVLLGRAWLRNRTRLLMWSALCFVGLAAANIFLVMDLVLFPDIDFKPARQISALLALTILIAAFIWEDDL